MIAIVDYNIGNISAISNMLNRIGIKNIITSDKHEVECADKIILPGNGAFNSCMKNLTDTGLIPIIKHKVFDEKTPLLGICVGAQLLGNFSEEGNEYGLGWIKMKVKKFPNLLNLKIPHMGWNHVNTDGINHPLLNDFNNETRFYFTHSYYMDVENADNILLCCDYGIKFAAAVYADNIVGVQFHPEKSHRFGKDFLLKFGKDM